MRNKKFDNKEFEKTKEELVFEVAKQLLNLEYCDYEFVSNLQDKLIRLQHSEIFRLKEKIKELEKKKNERTNKTDKKKME